MTHELHEVEQGYDDNFVMLYHDQMDLLVANAKPSTIAVFLAILRRANRNNGNTCFPSLDTIATESGVSRRTVTLAIKELTDLRLLTVTHRRSEAGDATSNLYRVLRPSAKSAGGSAKTIPTVGTKSAPPVVQNLHPNKTKSEPDELGLDLVGDTSREQRTPRERNPNPKPLRSTAIDDDFWPASPGIENWARSHNVALSAIHAQVQPFIDHHIAKGSRMVDWDRAFYTWLNNAERWGHFRPDRQGKNATSRSPGKRGYTADELMEQYFESHGGGWDDWN